MTRRINKSARKRARQAERRRLRNKAIKTRIKNTIKKYLRASGDEKKVLLSEIYSLLDSAVSKGVIHRNTAARKKSRLTRLLNVGG